jgi:peptidoglycan/xylan/chitin deacetylase (PgdA/CDA1 family)
MKRIAKFIVYQMACPLLLFFGVDKLLRRRASNKRLIILYHGVSGKKNFTINGRHTFADEFEKHLKYFRKNFDVLSLQDLCEDKNSIKKSRRPTIALTFDDGYLNNFKIAIPLLRKYQMPATFFVSTKCLNDETYIHPSDYIDLIQNFTPDEVSINGLLFIKRNKQLVRNGLKAYDYINELSFEELKQTLAELSKKYPFKSVTAGVDPDVYGLVSCQILGSISDKLFTIGSHSHDHVNLTKLSEDEQRNQLGTSKILLQASTRRFFHSIAFPYGYFDSSVVKGSISHGYEYLIAAGSVPNEWKHLVFPRIGMLNMAGYAYNMLSINRGFKNFGF